MCYIRRKKVSNLGKLYSRKKRREKMKASRVLASVSLILLISGFSNPACPQGVSPDSVLTIEVPGGTTASLTQVRSALSARLANAALIWLNNNTPVLASIISQPPAKGTFRVLATDGTRVGDERKIVVAFLVDSVSTGTINEILYRKAVLRLLAGSLRSHQGESLPGGDPFQLIVESSEGTEWARKAEAALNVGD